MCLHCFDNKHSKWEIMLNLQHKIATKSLTKKSVAYIIFFEVWLLLFANLKH